MNMALGRNRSGKPAILETEQDTLVGHIPVRNIWLLMLYASSLFRNLPPTRFVQVEESPEKIADLVAEILCSHVELRMRRQLTKGYVKTNSDLTRVRGRIDVLTTERGLLLDKGKVHCEYEELTVDTPRNCLIRSALDSVSGLVDDHALAHRCRAGVHALQRMGVLGPAPQPAEVARQRLTRNDALDRTVVDAALLAMTLKLPTELEGRHSLPAPQRDEQFVRRLFEKAMAGLCYTALTPAGWVIQEGKRLSWPLEASTPGMSQIFPHMQTDITLMHSERRKHIVVDTKFTSIVKPGFHRNETLKSNYIYQMYAYLRSQEGKGDVSVDQATGVLLHPAVDRHLDESVHFQGHTMRFLTVDLAACGSEIRRQALTVVEGID